MKRTRIKEKRVRTVQTIHKLRSSMINSWWHRWGQQNYVKFVVLGNARTGSNLLSAFLQSNHAIEMYGEIFAQHSRVKAETFDETIDILYGRRSPRIKAVGCKIFYTHLEDQEWQHLSNMAEIRPIHLVRRNRLRTVLSLVIARKTNQWTLNKTDRAIALTDRRINLEPDFVLSKIAKIEYREEKIRKRFGPMGLLEVAYEDIIADPLGLMSKLAHHLGLPPWSSSSSFRLKRQNPESLEQLIENYAEMAAALEQTPYAVYLGE